MKTTDTIRRAWRNLNRAKMRTFLTSVAIAVGGFAIMVSLMAGEGARQYVDRIISANMDPNAISIAKDKRMFGASGASPISGGLREYREDSIDVGGGMDIDALTQADIDKLSERSDIEDVVPNYQLQPKYIEFSVEKDKKYIGSVQVYDDTTIGKTAAGSLPGLREQIKDDEIVIPAGYLETLGVKNAADAIGSTVSITITRVPQAIDPKEIQQIFMTEGEAGAAKRMTGETKVKQLKVRAVIEKSADEIMSQSALFVSASAAREMSEYTTKGTDSYQKYLVAAAIVKKGYNPEEVKDSLKKAGYNAATAKDLQSFIFTFINILQGIVMGFGALALVVSVFGIVNTMYISVLERTQQIGLMKALGASGRDIGRLFRYEAAWVGFLGGALGVLLALGGATAFNPMISEALSLGEFHLLIFQPLAGAAVILGLILVAVVAGWLPSRRAAKLDPIEALRTE